MAQVNITAVELTDTFNTFRTRSNTGFVAVNALTGIVDPDTKAITANGTGAVSLSPAGANVTISPTGAGAVTIAPATTVAITPTGALTLGTSGQTTTVNATTVTLANATSWNINGANPSLASTATGTLSLFNANITAANILGGQTGTVTVGSTSTTASPTYNLLTAANTAGTKTINIGTGGAAGSTTSINVGTTAGTSSITLNAPTVAAGSASLTLFNTTATSVTAFGAATSVSLGATTGTTSINNATVTFGNATAFNINGANPTIASTSTGTLTLFNTALTTVNAFQAATAITIGATTGTTTVRNNLTVSGNLVVNGTTTTVNSTVTTIDDPIIVLGGDTDVAEVTMDRGIEFRHSGASITITQIVSNNTTTVTATVASTTGYRTGDSITTTGATANAALNGTFRITVVNATTFTYVVGTTIATATFTTGLGTTIKSEVGFMGFDVSLNRFMFADQSANTNEVIDGTDADIEYKNSYSADGTAALPAKSFVNDTNTGIYRVGADEIGVSTNGALRFSINSVGDGNFTGTGALKLQTGTTAQRPATALTGHIRFNTSISQFEGYNGTAWASVGGGATGGGADRVFIENDQTISTNYTISTNRNAGTFGPVSIANGVIVTIPNGSVWTVV